jgi:hypothetical protein
MPWVVYVPSLLHFWWKLPYRCSTSADVPTPFLLLTGMLVCNGVEFKNFFMLDSGLSDIGLSCFIIGLIRYRTEGLQSDKFFSDIGQGNIDVGYRRQKYLMSCPPMVIKYIICLNFLNKSCWLTKPYLNFSKGSFTVQKQWRVRPYRYYCSGLKFGFFKNTWLNNLDFIIFCMILPGTTVS